MQMSTPGQTLRSLTPPSPGLLRSRMLLLILLILCPLFSLALYGNLQQRKIERAGAEERMRAVAQLGATREANLFDRSRELMTSVASYPFLVLAEDKKYSTMECTYLRALAPGHTNFGLIEANGTLFCSAERTNA